MSDKSPSKDEALEALDFIVNVLKEHEKDLDKLVSELGTVADQMGETGELTAKVEKIEEKINGLQNNMNTLLKCVSASPREIQATAAANLNETVSRESPRIDSLGGPSVLFRCKQWEDFLIFAAQAQTVSFMFKDSDRTFEVNALKNNQVVSFSGELPKLASLLKAWLGKEMSTSEKKILEGSLSLS
jgi:hypothetical protein